MVVHQRHEWDRKSLSVCWRVNNSVEAPSYFGRAAIRKITRPPAFVRRAIQRAVTREFGIERVGIEFTGWHDCRPGRLADVQLLYAFQQQFIFADTGSEHINPGLSSTLGRARVLGGSADLSQPRSKLYLLFHFLWDASELRKREILEVYENLMEAHGIHEFGHLAGLLHEYELRETGSTKFGYRVTPLDENSAMRPLQPPSALSEGDIHGLRCLYKFSGQEKIEKCQISQP